MDISKKFTLGVKPTQEQIDFFNELGFIHFKQVLSPQQVNKILGEVSRIEQEWIQNHHEVVNGIPIKFGKDENGNTIVQRFAFTSLHSDYIHSILQDERIRNLKYFIGEEARLAEDERDGMVVNHYVNTSESNYTRLGWHTDGARDLLTHLGLDPMLNVGLYFTDSMEEQGGLRVIPGSHKQGFFRMLFYKKYFIDNTPDKNEIPLYAQAGDVTVHSGRIWHRVALSPHQGALSNRIVSYVPIVAGKYRPKSAKSSMPVYHRFLHKIK